MVVEWSVVRVLDPAAAGAGAEGHLVKEPRAERQIADLVGRRDVVDLSEGAAVQDGVEGVGGVACVEVAPGGGAVAVEDHGLGAVEEAGEFGDDFWGV